MHFKVGDQLLARFGTFGDRLMATVVDMNKDKTLTIFLRLPPPILKHIQDDATVSIQYVHESTLMGFGTTIKNCCTQPACVLTLNWPTSVENQDPRSEKRLDCSFPGTLSVDGLPYRCMVENLSRSGVRVRILHQTDMKILPLFDQEATLILDFYALEERNRYSFSCSMLREFICDSNRFAVLLISEREHTIRRVLETYVADVLGAFETTADPA